MIAASLLPKAEMVHWGFATGFLTLGLLLVAETVVGREVWALRPWRTLARMGTEPTSATLRGPI